MPSDRDDTIDIVHLLGEPWATNARRPHIAANSKYARVLCVERAPRRLPCLSAPDPDRNGALRQESESLWLYEPSRLLPHLAAAPLGPAGRLNKRILADQVQPVLEQLGFAHPAVIVAHPLMGYLTDLFPGSVICYEVTDNWASHGPGSRWAKLLAKRAEDRLLADCHLVLASAYALYRDKRARHEHTVYLPNSAEVEHFRGPNGAHRPPPADMEHLPRPWVGFAGNIMNCLDMDFLAASVQLRPDWSWVFVGPVTGDRAFLRSAGLRAWRQCPNVHELGWRAYEILPRYVAAFDACILPYARGPVMYGALPNKVFQYLATGSPVVATPFPETEFFPDDIRDVVRIAETPREFCDLIEKALAEDCEDLRRARVRVADRNTCDIRARQRVQALRECLQAR